MSLSSHLMRKEQSHLKYHCSLDIKTDDGQQMDKNAFLSGELGILFGWFQKIKTGLNSFFYTLKYHMFVNRFLILWFLIF